MLLSIQEMEVRKVAFNVVREPGTLDFAGSGAKQVTPLHAAGEAELLPESDGQVRVQGRVSVALEAECDRCLGTAKFAIAEPFDLFYQPNSSVPQVDEIAIRSGDTEVGFYESPGLELDQILQEQVLLRLPMHLLCSEDCQGICSICGKNRNDSDCNCTTVLADDRWSGLKHFKVG